MGTAMYDLIGEYRQLVSLGDRADTDQTWGDYAATRATATTNVAGKVGTGAVKVGVAPGRAALGRAAKAAR